MNIIRRLLLRLMTMPHTRAFIVGAVDNAEERAHFRGMLVEVFGAGTLSSAVAFVLFANVLMAPLQDAPVLGPVFDEALPDGINIVARAPGTDPAFALNFCNDPATKVERPLFPVPEDAGRLVATRGTDNINYSGTGGTARYETSSEGRDIDITPAAVDCLRKKVK